MEKVERFINTIERKPVDKPASWLGIPVKEAYKKLFEYFKVDSIDVYTKR